PGRMRIDRSHSDDHGLPVVEAAAVQLSAGAGDIGELAEPAPAMPTASRAPGRTLGGHPQLGSILDRHLDLTSCRQYKQFVVRSVSVVKSSTDDEGHDGPGVHRTGS